MKRLGFYLLGVVLVAGVAGCSVGFDDGPRECVSYYCDIFCNEAVDCGLIPAAEVASCIPVCEADHDSKSEEECQQTFSAIVSCDEVADILGVRSALELTGRTGCFTP